MQRENMLKYFFNFVKFNFVFQIYKDFHPERKIMREGVGKSTIFYRKLINEGVYAAKL